MPKTRTARLVKSELIDPGEGTPGGTEAVLVYEIDGWVATIRAFVYSPSGDFDSLHLEPPGYPQQFTTPAGGITYDLMRAIPLQKARVEIDALKAKAWRENGDTAEDAVGVTQRMNSEGEWLRFASVYAEMVAAGERNPTQRITRVSGLSKDTINTRVRRAREKGLLTRPTKDNLGELTRDAKKALKALDAKTERGA